MNINIRKINDSAAMPESGLNSVNIKCIQFGTGIGKDGKLIIEYKTGLEVEIPDGYIGIVSPTDASFIYSLIMPTSINTLTAGWHEILPKFKVNTDSVPSVYEQGEDCVKLVLVKADTLEFTDVTPVPEPAIEAHEEQIAVEEVNEAYSASDNGGHQGGV